MYIIDHFFKFMKDEKKLDISKWIFIRPNMLELKEDTCYDLKYSNHTYIFNVVEYEYSCGGVFKCDADRRYRELECEIDIRLYDTDLIEMKFIANSQSYSLIFYANNPQIEEKMFLDSTVQDMIVSSETAIELLEIFYSLKEMLDENCVNYCL